MSPKNLNATIKIPKLLNKLKNKRVSRIYKKFEKSLNINDNFIVGVSGGPDSLALAFLTKILSLKKGLKPKFIVIDHKLRNESSKEAKLVKKALNKFSIKTEILIWRGQKPLKNIQSLARQKRYSLFFSKCIKHKINDVILGHQNDDLIENFFLRLSRGSGLKGLVSLGKKTQIGKINIHRPLLDFKKDDLIFLSKYVFDFYIKDPSNDNTKFQRIKFRHLLTEFEKIGLDKKKFNLTLKNLKNSDEAIKFYVKQNQINNSYYFLNSNRMLLNLSFFDQPSEIVFRSFSEILQKISKKFYPPRGKKNGKIIEKIKFGTFSKVTLGGCIIEKVNQTVILSKER